MPELIHLIWTGNAALLGWVLSQYFKLRKEVNLLQLSLVKNYATNEALEKIINTQNKLLETLTEMKISQATIFERIERFHSEEINHTKETEHHR